MCTKKRFGINFSKADTEFCLSLHYNADNSYLFVNGKEIFKSLGNISNEFSATEFREVSLNLNIYDFSVHYNYVAKYDI